MKASMHDMFVALSIAACGGVVAVLGQIRRNKHMLSFIDIISQIVMAVFAGFLVHCICIQFEVTAPGTGYYLAAISLAGYTARPLITRIKRAILGKFGLFLGSSGGGVNDL